MILPALLAPASPWRVAYVARVYYPAGDRRVSHHQVYLCDLQGGHARRVTDGPHECWSVRWLDHATVAWTRDDGTLWRLRADGGRPTLWKREKPGDFDPMDLPDELCHLGQPVFVLDQRYRYMGGKLVSAGSSKGFLTTPGCDVRLTDDDKLVNAKGELHLQTDEEGMRPVAALCGPGKGDLWVMGWSSLSTWGVYYSLARYDRRTGKVLWKRGEFKDLDFRPQRSTYALAKVRETKPLGRQQVWTAPALVGDWRTGREWAISPAMSEAWSVSLRP